MDGTGGRNRHKVAVFVDRGVLITGRSLGWCAWSRGHMTPATTSHCYSSGTASYSGQTHDFMSQTSPCVMSFSLHTHTLTHGEISHLSLETVNHLTSLMGVISIYQLMTSITSLLPTEIREMETLLPQRPGTRHSRVYIGLNLIYLRLQLPST